MNFGAVSNFGSSEAERAEPIAQARGMAQSGSERVSCREQSPDSRQGCSFGERPRPDFSGLHSNSENLTWQPRVGYRHSVPRDCGHYSRIKAVKLPNCLQASSKRDHIVTITHCNVRAYPIAGAGGYEVVVITAVPGKTSSADSQDVDNEFPSPRFGYSA